MGPNFINCPTLFLNVPSTAAVNGRLVIQHRNYYTISESPRSVYGEKIISRKGEYLRFWDPKRSKLAAALAKGLEHFPFSKDSKVLYLGASTGTTVSHVSDLCNTGKVFAVESSYEPFVKLIKLSEWKENIYPILEDANYPEKYSFFLDNVGVVYQDISQRNQVQIFNNNSEHLSTAREAILVLKIRAISSRKSEKQILNESLEDIKSYRIKEVVNLKPFHKSHYLIYMNR